MSLLMLFRIISEWMKGEYKINERMDDGGKGRKRRENSRRNE